MSKAPSGRQPARRNRLLQLLAAAVLVIVIAKAVSWSRGRSSGQHGLLTVACVAAGIVPSRGEASAVDGHEPHGPPMPAVDFVACLKETNTTASRAMTTDMYLSGEPTRLDLAGIFLSKTRAPVGETTMVVTYDVGRLYMLEGLCQLWGGPIAAAVYVAVGNSSEEDAALTAARLRVGDVHSRASVRRTCLLDILLFSETLDAGDALMPNLFPVNSLRNRALLLAQTELVLVMDGDLLIQASARKKARPGTPRGDALLKAALQKAYHVLPAFETASMGTAYDVALGDKAAASAALNGSRILRFGANKSPYPQGCTDFDRWRAAKQQYNVTYCNRYEPWGIVHRQHTPWFDARFRGYGRNKIMYAAALNSSGFDFVVDPDTFVIHRPHGVSGAHTVFYEAPDRRVHTAIMEMFRRQKHAGRFVPFVDATTLACKGRLPWWKGHVQEQGEAFYPLAAEVAAAQAARAAKAGGGATAIEQ